MVILSSDLESIGHGHFIMYLARPKLYFYFNFLFHNFFDLKNIYLNNKFVDQGYKTEKLLTALNKLN